MGKSLKRENLREMKEVWNVGFYRAVNAIFIRIAIWIVINIIYMLGKKIMISSCMLARQTGSCEMNCLG